jgi:hypothetical protein
MGHFGTPRGEIYVSAGFYSDGFCVRIVTPSFPDLVFRYLTGGAKQMRILSKIAFGTVSAIVLLVLLAPIADKWLKARMYYPSFENKSAFLRAYSLKRVIEPYIAPPGGSGDIEGSGGGAGMNSVTHTADLAEHFTMRSVQKQSLMLAVDGDVAERLRMSGAQILSRNGSSSTGFDFKYSSGRTAGSISIHPLAPDKVQRNLPLADGLEDVALTVDIKEEWFPKGIPEEVARTLPHPLR